MGQEKVELNVAAMWRAVHQLEKQKRVRMLVLWLDSVFPFPCPLFSLT